MPARRWRRPRAFAVALCLAGIALFVALGSWQWRRGEEKAELFAAFDRGFAQAPIALEQARRDANGAVYPHVVVRGSYVVDYEYLLENQVRDGRIGVMAFAPFQPAEGGDPLLVNRGFLPYSSGSGDRRYPVLPPLPRGEVTLSGLYAPPPGAGLRLGGNGLAVQKYPKKVVYLDLAEVGADLRRRLDPRVLLLLPEPDATGARFVREWRPEVFPPERHYGYALTWFTFAAVVVATFAILHWRRTPQ